MGNVSLSCEDFLCHCKDEKNLSDKTLKAYGIDLKQFSNYMSEQHSDIKVNKIGKEILSDYFRIIHESGKPKTVKRKLATLRAFFNYLEYEDRIVVNPLRKMKVEIEDEKPHPVTIDLKEIKRLLNHVYAQAEHARGKTWYAQKTLARDIAILELFFATGLRVSELCDLKTNDVDLEKGMIQIDGKGIQQRMIPLMGEPVKKALLRYFRMYEKEIKANTYFFLNRQNEKISDQSVRFMVKKYCDACGIQKKVTPHTFRHTVAAMLLESGVDIRYIQQFLGHGSITTTQAYAQVNEEIQKEILSEKHPRGLVEVDSELAG